jgi:Tectonin domain
VYFQKDGFNINDGANGWTHSEGICATDIGSNAGQVWAIGCEHGQYGASIYYLAAENQWAAIDGAAVSIDVHPDGFPYVVNSENKVFRRNRITNSWDYLDAYARQVAVGADGSLWGLSVDTVPGGSSVNRYPGGNLKTP